MQTQGILIGGWWRALFQKNFFPWDTDLRESYLDFRSDQVQQICRTFFYVDLSKIPNLCCKNPLNGATPVPGPIMSIGCSKSAGWPKLPPLFRCIGMRMAPCDLPSSMGATCLSSQPSVQDELNSHDINQRPNWRPLVWLTHSDLHNAANRWHGTLLCL